MISSPLQHPRRIHRLITMAPPKQDNSVAAAAAAPSPAKPPAVLQPVALLDTPLAGWLAALRPAVLLGLLYVGFGSLVADPEYTLQLALPIVALVQAVYAVFCLPIAGSPAARKQRPGEKKRSDASAPNPAVTAVLALLLTLIVTPAIHVLFVLFGAPLLDHVARTLLCAAHFSLLGLFPVFYARGIDSQALLAIAGASAPLDETFGALLGAVLGAWLGAVPIPLDWDRDWQTWPVTVVVGMFLGSGLVAKVCGGVPVVYGKQLGAAEEQEE
ncbi:Glycosylphosphatidylinositol anchor biosynthesis protein [Paramyrothecium foliicola]|nr:Glycosylphosphatidylinositol anchor biosynthesis protein [Paramyrothecium foliicola]